MAKTNGASSFTVVPVQKDLELGIRGDHQRINASLAIGLSKSFLEVTTGKKFNEDLPESFKAPLRKTKWPGRCQSINKGDTTWLLDGAHTTESLRSCGEWAWKEGKPNVLIFNCSGGRAGETLLGSLMEAGSKASGQTSEELGKGFDTVIFCTNVTYTSGGFKGGECTSPRCTCPGHVEQLRFYCCHCCCRRCIDVKLMIDLTSNAIDPNDLAQLATQNALRDAWIKLNPSFPTDRVHALPSIEHAVNIVNGLEGEKQVLVAGSLHLVGGVMEVAGLQDHLGME